MYQNSDKYLEYLELSTSNSSDPVRLKLLCIVDGRKEFISDTIISLTTLEGISRRFCIWQNYYIYVDQHLCKLTNIKIDFKIRKVTFELSHIAIHE